MSSFSEAFSRHIGNTDSSPTGIISLSDIFEEEPVDLTTFVQDSKFLNNPPLSPIQYEAVRHIERIYLPETYALMGEEWSYWADPVRMCNLFTVQWGKGSGKDSICRIASMRIAYLLLCLKSPQRYFGLPEQDSIHMLNIASSSGQAQTAYFTPMTKAIKRGWFADKAEGKQSMIVYDKNIEAISGHSEAESQEGLNLILGVADEIDAFKTKEEVERYRGRAARESSRSAEYILEMLHTSASSRFPETYKNVFISYPRYLGSTIQKLTEKARANIEESGANSIHYVSGPLLTWEVNPRYDRFEKIPHPNTDELIPNIKSMIEDYDNEPKMAKAKYECKPSRSIDGFFKNFDLVRNSVTEEPQPITIEYELRDIVSEVTGRKTKAWNPVFRIDSSLQPIAGAQYVIHTDLAIKGDRAGIAMSHVLRWEDRIVYAYDEEGGQHEKVERLPFVKVDFVTAFEASNQTNPQRDIQIRWARELIFELRRRGFNIVSASYDGFQSVDSMQLLELHGIESKRKSTDRDDIYWKTLKDLSYEGRLQMPFSQILMNELEALGTFAGRIDHPPNGSKDLADALAVSASTAIEFGGSEVEDKEIVYPGSTEFIIGESGALEHGYEMIDNPFSAAPSIDSFTSPYRLL